MINEVLRAYSMGLFPMANRADADEFVWYEAKRRGLLPIRDLHVSKRLQRTVLSDAFEVRVDTAFADVIEGCAARSEKRRETWINRGIMDLFQALHEAGHAHSVECWRDDVLVGGIYGLEIGGMFGGESMFSRARDASKVALVHLTARLWRGGFSLFDTQLINPHLRQFGAFEVSAREYGELLDKALARPADFYAGGRRPEDERALVADFLSTANSG